MIHFFTFSLLILHVLDISSWEVTWDTFGDENECSQSHGLQKLNTKPPEVGNKDANICFFCKPKENEQL